MAASASTASTPVLHSTHSASIENDEEVDREEGERERDRIESSSTGEVAGTLMPSLSADAASPTSPATEQNPTARFSPQERLTK